VELLTALLNFKMNTFSLLTVLVSEYAPEGLGYLSQHLLGVSALCEDVTQAIQVLTDRLCTVIGEDVLSKKHEDQSDQLEDSSHSLSHLSRYVLDYFQWLRNHKGPLVKLSRVAEVVHCVHPSLRSREDFAQLTSARFSLQNETYRSNQEIVTKYKKKYREHLTLIHLPQQTFRRDDVRQVTITHY
jgi:hypothetical protein